MKKQYIQPAAKCYKVNAVRLLAGSGPGATEQNDPTISSRDDEEDLFSLDRQVLGDNVLFDSFL